MYYYDLNFSDIGNVSFNFLVKKALPKQYLMNIKATNTNLGVFVKNDNKVYLDISGTEVATTIPFSLNTLTYFSLSWENYLDSDDTYIDVYLMVNSRTYYYNGDLLVTEVDNNTRKDYTYDNNGLLIGLKYKNSYGIIKTYYYIRDALGNINGLIDENGYLVVEYKYDAYGNNLGIFILTHSALNR